MAFTRTLWVLPTAWTGEGCCVSFSTRSNLGIYFDRNNSGGPAGGQTFKKFDKQVLTTSFQVPPKSCYRAFLKETTQPEADWLNPQMQAAATYSVASKLVSQPAHSISVCVGRSPSRRPLRFGPRNEGQSARAICFRGGSPRRRRHAFKKATPHGTGRACSGWSSWRRRKPRR